MSWQPEAAKRIRAQERAQQSADRAEFEKLEAEGRARGLAEHRAECDGCRYCDPATCR